MDHPVLINHVINSMADALFSLHIMSLCFWCIVFACWMVACNVKLSEERDVDLFKQLIFCQESKVQLRKSKLHLKTAEPFRRWSPAHSHSSTGKCLCANNLKMCFSSNINIKLASKYLHALFVSDLVVVGSFLFSGIDRRGNTSCANKQTTPLVC